MLDRCSFTRKEFFRILWIILLIPAIWLWYSLISRQRSASPSFLEIRIPSTVSLGISFFDRVIAINNAGKLVFLPSRCTHLGCKIYTAEHNELICPCHGSRFGMDGRNLMGPASRPLGMLSYRIDQRTKEFIVKIPAE
jgi:Rieske Fe-S protein